ncbi:MAG: hypothetical protein SFU56_16135 [Capsulimonadales bacterium]|nr:hypothetical protein [Capsulimonadales bacterium]
MADTIQLLAERYPLTEVTIAAAGRDWRIVAVTDQDALANRIRTEEDLCNFPYGLMLWASAIGLAQKLSAEPERIRGRRVLEIGAGIGVAGLAAAHLGGVVTQTDYLEEALILCRHNARVNGIAGTVTRRGDWRAWPSDLPPFPVVIGSDVLYDREMHPVLRELLPSLVEPGGTVLLSDPIRPQALDFTESLERTGRWSVAMEGLQVRFESQVKDLALFHLTLETDPS